MSRRFLVLHMPAFRLERVGYEASQAAGLIDERKNAMRLVALTPAAQDLGLRLEMTAAEARARVPHIALAELDSQAEQDDRRALLRQLEPLSDLVAFPWDNDAVVDITHTLKWFGGERPLMKAARHLITSLGHRLVLAIADDPLSAAAIARFYGEDRILEPHASNALEPLPLRLLVDQSPSASNMLASLLAVGVQRAGELARLPAEDVSHRFGQPGLDLWRRCLGHQVSQMVWGEACEAHPTARVAMAGATTSLQLQFVLGGLLAELCHKLEQSGLAVVRLRLVFRLEVGWGGRNLDAGEEQEVRSNRIVWIRVGRPTRNVEVLETLIHKRLENFSLNAPVDEWLIEVAESVPEQGWQPGLTDRTEATEPLPDLLARLKDHVGDSALFSPRLADAWKPEDAWKAGVFPAPLWTKRRPKPTADPVLTQLQFEPASPGRRPVRLLPNPTEVHVTMHCGRPMHLMWEGRKVQIIDAQGPERLQGGWWTTASFLRDYWIFQLEDGQVIWVYFGQDRWLLHGLF